MTVRHRKSDRRWQRLYSRHHGTRRAIRAFHALLWSLAILAAPSALLAQSTSAFSENPLGLDGAAGVLARNGIIGTGGKSVAPATVPGTPFNEILRGNGTRYGYILTHAGVIPDTLSVRVGGQHMRMGRDLWVDPSSGSLIFGEAVPSTESISVYYRYVEGQDANRQAATAPSYKLAFGANTSASLFYGMATGTGNGFDVSTYGLSMSSKFGAGGSSTYNGLMYFSNIQKSTNLTIPTQASSQAQAATPAVKTGGDELIVQNFGSNLGKLNLRANFQDVGANFAGFQSLKLTNANDKAAMDQLTQLEGEKGIKRLGFGLGFNTTPKGGKVAEGLSLDWNQIADTKGAITQEAIGYTSSAFKFNYAARNVTQNFSLFQGLREADKTQWQREKGMSTSALSAGLNFGATKKGVSRGGFDFVEQQFGDTTGSLHREAINLTSGALNFSISSRRSELAFTRMKDLSDADRTALAFDVYKQYNPAAKLEQVTPKDKEMVGHEAGLDRSGLRADYSMGKTGAIAFSEVGVSDLTDPKVQAGFVRDSITIDTKTTNLAWIGRRADLKFTRIGDLSDIEKTYLALDIRRQFDMNATPEQVTQKERDQAAAEVGLARAGLRVKSVLGKGGKVGTLAFSQFSVEQLVDTASGAPQPPTPGAIRRTALDFTSKNAHFYLLNQSISNAFTRLTTLSEFERAQFANEYGLQKQQVSLNLQVNKTTKFAFNSLSVGGTQDTVAAARLAAQQANTDLLAAVQAAGAGLSRSSVQLEAKGLNFLANFARTDKQFSRSSDLAMTAPEKAAVEAERGFNRSDMTLHYDRIKGLTVDSYSYGARNSLDRLAHDIQKQNINFTPNKHMQLTYVQDSDLTSNTGKMYGVAHSLFTFNQALHKGMLLNLYQDKTTNYDGGLVSKSANTDYLNFETDKTKPNTFKLEEKRVTYLDGKFENTSNLNVHAKPSKTMSFTLSRSDVERAGTIDDPTETTDAFDFQWQATKKFAVLASMSQRETTNNTDGDVVSLGLSGQPVRNVTLAAKFDEVHNNGANTKDVADIAISNDKPISLGPIKDLTVTARYASLNDQRKLQNEAMTGRATWKIWKNEVLLDYGGTMKIGGAELITRTYSFATDPNPKKWFHASFLYKSHPLPTGEERLVRRFTADMRLAKNTSFIYNFGTMPEDEKSNILPVTTANISLKHGFTSILSSEFFYKVNANDTTKLMTRGLGFSIAGQLDKISKLELSFSKDANGFTDHYDRSDHVKLLYDHQIGPEHFLTLSMEYRSHDYIGQHDETQFNADIRSTF